MAPLLDIHIGDTCGKWTVIDVPGRRMKHGQQIVVCQCACGTIADRSAAAFKKGTYQGCLKCKKPSRLRHGHMRIGQESLTHSTWRSMLDWCENPDSPSWPWYGAEGIKVCERWYTFDNFLADMGERPGKTYTLDRIDVKQDYSPGNCHWILLSWQNRNKRTNRLLTLNGITQPMVVWAEQLGISPGTIRSRLRYGWSDEDALTLPINTRFRQRS